MERPRGTPAPNYRPEWRVQAGYKGTTPALVLSTLQLALVSSSSRHRVAGGSQRGGPAWARGTGGWAVGWGGQVVRGVVASNPDSHGKTTQKPSKQPGDDPSPRQEEAETQKPKKGVGSGG